MRPILTQGEMINGHSHQCLQSIRFHDVNCVGDVVQNPCGGGVDGACGGEVAESG